LGVQEIEIKPKLPPRAEAFKVNKTVHTSDYLDSVWHEIMLPLMEDDLQKTRPIRNQSAFNCKGCEYHLLCQGALNKDDIDFIRKERYYTKYPAVEVTLTES
jgi:hypothetical protein